MRAYKNLEKPERCPAELYKKYLSHVPDNLPGSDNSFYLRGLSKANAKIWYYRKAGLTGHSTNHSLRRSCATKLYENNIPEQVIHKKQPVTDQ